MTYTMVRVPYNTLQYNVPQDHTLVIKAPTLPQGRDQELGLTLLQMWSLIFGLSTDLD